MTTLDFLKESNWTQFFALFLAEMLALLNVACWFGVFKEDILQWDSHKYINKLESNFNLVLSKIHDFAAKNKLTYNVSKSAIIFFSTDKYLYKYHTKLFLNGAVLAQEKQPRYLGHIWEAEFICNKYIETLAVWCKKTLNILEYISGRDLLFELLLCFNLLC